MGITVLAALGILVWGMAWLKDFSLTRGKVVWKVAFAQAGGLSESDEVQVNGIRKGTVESMRLAGDQVIVELNLDPEVKLTTDSRVAIRNVGLMGEKVVAVDYRTTGRVYRTDEVIPGVFELGLGELLGQLGSTVDAIVAASTQLQSITLELTRGGRLETTITNFSRTSEELRLAVSENRSMLRATLSNFHDASRTAKSLTTDKEAELRHAMEHFASAAEKLDVLAVRLDSLRGTIQGVATKVESGEGTLGRLVGDEKLYSELSASVREFKQLVADIKANPKRYLKFSIF